MSHDAEQWKLLPQDHMARSTKLPWYVPGFENKLKPSFRKLLEEWSGIAPEDVESHIYQMVRSKFREPVMEVEQAIY
jgi:hypothetical protein